MSFLYIITLIISYKVGGVSCTAKKNKKERGLANEIKFDPNQ